MDRFMIFSGSQYYPNGGMSDFYSSCPRLDKAISAVNELAKEHEGGNMSDDFWGHIYDSHAEMVVWVYEEVV